MTASLAALVIAGTEAGAQVPNSFKWAKAVNNTDAVPGASGKVFNSYNQPSINAAGYLVFRARSKGPQPISGLYTRDLLAGSGVTEMLADRATEVPFPNNTTYPPDDLLAAFNEFPSIPRIAMWTNTVATRGNSQPVWSYLVDGADTRAGTSGIFLNPEGSLITGVNLLGAVPAPEVPVTGLNHFPYMAVPGAVPGTRFDVFPGSPALADGDVITFKGNYTEDSTGKTGVFFRDPIGSGGTLPVQLIANTSTVIPNLPTDVSGITFGSTAPPSAAGDSMVFLGLDNEEAPTYGGIYLAPLTPNPALVTLVGIGDAVPGETSQTFTAFGESLAFDGRYVAFWGAWGTEKKTLWLDCPEDGNADVLAYCAENYGDNYPVQVPVNQGIFVHDTQTSSTYQIARTGEDIADFVYWNFSGKPPGVGGSEEGDDGEPPRWRSTAFVALTGGPNDTFTVGFKARSGTIDPVENNYLNPVDGIYLADRTSITSVVDTTMDGQLVDPAAPAGSKVSAVGIEREGLRGRWLAVTATMLEPVSGEGMAGLYTSRTFAPVANPGKGTYSCVLDQLQEPTKRPTKLFVRANGSFAGKIRIDGKGYGVKGKLDGDGNATVAIRTGRKGTPLELKVSAGILSGIPILDLSVTGGTRAYVGAAIQEGK
jgi:hypothetical protein